MQAAKQNGMFGPRLTLFRLFGFPIRLDLSWIFIAVLLTWTLAGAYFPQAQSGLSPGSYLVMGLLGMLGLFASVVLHEIGHSVVARHYNLEIRGITLFIFGGVAEMMEEPRSPGVEFLVAIGGPLVSLALAGLFWLLARLPAPAEISGILQYLALVNTVLLVFNMVPALPLDGGRVLRAILWRFGGNVRRATLLCSRIGAALGWILIGLGLLQLLAGFIVGAIWWAILGMFLRGAAINAYQQLLLRRLLEGEPVRNFMIQDPVTVRETDTVEYLVEHYIYQHHHKTFPVTDGSGRLLGSVSTRQVREIPHGEWSAKTVGEIMEPVGESNTIGSGQDTLRALSTMNRGGKSRLLVVDGDQLQGILSLKDLMKFFSLKIELEEERA